jgi:hypothetical protein
MVGSHRKLFPISFYSTVCVWILRPGDPVTDPGRPSGERRIHIGPHVLDGMANVSSRIAGHTACIKLGSHDEIVLCYLGLARFNLVPLLELMIAIGLVTPNYAQSGLICAFGT